MDKLQSTVTATLPTPGPRLGSQRSIHGIEHDVNGVRELLNKREGARDVCAFGGDARQADDLTAMIGRRVR